MKESITFYTGALEDAVKNAILFIGSKKTIDILGDIRFEIHGDSASIYATDLSAIFKQDIQLARGSEENIVFQVEGKIFHALISKRTAEKILVNINDVGITIVVGRDSYKMPISNVDDFPELDPGDDFVNVGASLENSDFKQMVLSCSSFASDDELRPQICGINLNQNKNKKMSFVSTDGRSICVCDTDYHCAAKLDVNIPHKPFVAFCKCIDKDTLSKVDLFVSKNRSWIKAVIDNTTLMIRLIDGKFPNYEEVIPEKFDHLARVSKIEVETFKRLTVCSDSTHAVTLSISGSKSKNLNLKSFSLDAGMMASENIDLDEESDNSIERVSISSDYLATIVGLINGPMEIKTIGNTKIVSIKPISETDSKLNSIGYYVMPMMISDMETEE